MMLEFLHKLFHAYRAAVLSKTDYVSEHHQAPLALKKNIIQSYQTTVLILVSLPGTV